MGSIVEEIKEEIKEERVKEEIIFWFTKSRMKVVRKLN